MGEGILMKAHVICCNDSVEFVVVGSSMDAEDKMDVLSAQHRAKYFDNYYVTEEYKDIHFWHIHTVDVILTY